MENIKKFYEALAQDKAMQERAKVLNDTKPGEEAEAFAAIVAFAAQEGYSFTTAELAEYNKAQSKELSDDELEAVAGGATCVCVFVGSGGNGLMCACVVGGVGDNKTKKTVCVCPIGGGGTD
ncbi:MAG: Nif11-like leader peptide family RiPP precursor [Clostridiales bacterium]